MNNPAHFHRDMQRYIAITTIGPSTLRNQGAAGVIKAAREYLAVIDLGILHVKDESVFLRVLDAQTKALRKVLPRHARKWGAARKALNLFLRDACYNRFLCGHHGLATSEGWLEIPLDGVIARALKREAGRGKLPPWPGLIGLTPEISSKFQEFAKILAAVQGISRVHLDMRLWTAERASS